jgi:hypothetical protein
MLARTSSQASWALLRFQARRSSTGAGANRTTTLLRPSISPFRSPLIGRSKCVLVNRRVCSSSPHNGWGSAGPLDPHVVLSQPPTAPSMEAGDMARASDSPRYRASDSAGSLTWASELNPSRSRLSRTYRAALMTVHPRFGPGRTSIVVRRRPLAPLDRPVTPTVIGHGASSRPRSMLAVATEHRWRKPYLGPDLFTAYRGSSASALVARSRGLRSLECAASRI